MENNDLIMAAPPCPKDFDVFLPWACYELSVNANVVVHRCVQKQYVSAVGSGRLKTKLKSKSRASSPVETVTSGEFKTASAFAQSAMGIDKCIKIESVYDSHQNLVQITFLNNKAIPRQIMKIIGLILPFHKHLTSIVINSGLQMEPMYEMAKILPISRITELRLDNTYLAEANYSILLGQNNLKHLSLSKCKINDAVVKTITSKLMLSCPASTTLSVLNMASNNITDLGAKYIAKALRSNRHLSYLSLADNEITDKGATHIFNVLTDFILNDEELTDVRRSYIDYLRKYNDTINAMANQVRTTEVDKKSAKRKLLKTSAKKNKPVEKDNLFTESKYFSQDNILRVIESEHVLEDQLGPFIHPFSLSNTEKRDSATYCFGNNTLCYLNLAYNHLTYLSIKKLLEVLLNQKFRSRMPRGLVNVNIEGNPLPETCIEYQEIDDLIVAGLQNTKRASEVIKKKPSSYFRSASERFKQD